jgi:hypothetical protein
MFKKWFKKFEDKSRDKLFHNLLDIGIQCELDERGVNEEKLFNPWYRKSLGIIRINSDSPINYINIIKQDRSKDSPPRWWFFFAIPSHKIRDKNDSIEIKSIRKKSIPIFGKVESIIWKSNENSKELEKLFSQDSGINSLATTLGNIKVKSLHKNFSGYSIEIDRKILLDNSHWDALDRISKMCLDLDKN